MFAVIVSGKPVLTQFVQSDETKILFEIPDADSANHVVVFMTGAQLLPENCGASVYFFWPASGWTLLGFLANDKPSTIFKISGLKQAGGNVSNPFGQQVHSTAQLGISIQPITELTQLTPASNTQVAQVDTYLEFSTKMAENLFNYIASFAIADPATNQSYVPINYVNQWYENFKRKLAGNPNFWKS